ncbi:MAG: hypothetical protein ACI4W2_12625 [Eubacterium sp.]
MTKGKEKGIDDARIELMNVLDEVIRLTKAVIGQQIRVEDPQKTITSLRFVQRMIADRIDAVRTLEEWMKENHQDEREDQ